MGGKINPKLLAIAGVVLVALVAFAAFSMHRMQLANRLVATAADQVPGDAKLVSYAHEVAAPIFAKTCARRPRRRATDGTAAPHIRPRRGSRGP